MISNSFLLKLISTLSRDNVVAEKCFNLPIITIVMFTVYKHCFCYSNVPAIKTEEHFVPIPSKSRVGTCKISMGDL